MKKYLKYIPSLITLVNLFCGFLSIVFGEIYLGIILIVLGALADVMDGLVARILGADSAIGKELDSLADVVTFGVAPAYLYFLIAPEANALLLIPLLLYVGGGALRLAKFNTLKPSKYFRGLPIPAAALFMVGFLFAHLKNEPTTLYISDNIWLYAVIPAALGILMNTNITMFSFKSLQKDINTNFLPVLLVILMVIFVIIDYRLAIPLTIVCYIIFSYVGAILAKVRTGNNANS